MIQLNKNASDYSIFNFKKEVESKIYTKSWESSSALPRGIYRVIVRDRNLGEGF